MAVVAAVLNTDALTSRNSLLEVVLDSENTHVIAGDIFAPGSNERVVRRALEFATRAAARGALPARERYRV